MPKKIELSLVFKRSVRSKELITLLNNFRQSVSYEDILRTDTTWAARILEANHGHSTIPTDIRETIFFKPPLIIEITVKKTTLNM